MKKGVVKKRVVKTPIMQKGRQKVVFEKSMEPVETKFGIRNVLQSVIGAIVLAIPIGFTEETWRLGETLPLWNVFLILALSIVLVGLFAYRNLKRNKPNVYWFDLGKRIFLNYIISFIVVAIILSIIQKAPWLGNYILAVKRTIIIAFPSSLSATIASNLK